MHVVYLWWKIRDKQNSNSSWCGPSNRFLFQFSFKAINTACIIVPSSKLLLPFVHRCATCMPHFLVLPLFVDLNLAVSTGINGILKVIPVAALCPSKLNSNVNILQILLVFKDDHEFLYTFIHFPTEYSSLTFGLFADPFLCS